MVCEKGEQEAFQHNGIVIENLDKWIANLCKLFDGVTDTVSSAFNAFFSLFHSIETHKLMIGE